jgi:hypothetical protein
MDPDIYPFAHRNPFLRNPADRACGNALSDSTPPLPGLVSIGIRKRHPVCCVAAPSLPWNSVIMSPFGWALDIARMVMALSLKQSALRVVYSVERN